jgi:hypothetical protein
MREEARNEYFSLYIQMVKSDEFHFKKKIITTLRTASLLLLLLLLLFYFIKY